MGGDGLTAATELAILNANYIAHRLDAYFPVLYKGSGGTVAHECILDVRGITAATGVTVDDIAKRLTKAQRRDIDSAVAAAAMEALADLGVGEVEHSKRGTPTYKATGELP